MGRNIGAAFADLRSLCTVWKNATISLARNIELFHSIIGSKLKYAAASMWFMETDMRQLDGFLCRCLRKMHSRASSVLLTRKQRRSFEKSEVSEVIGDHHGLALEPVRPGDQRPRENRIEEGRFPWRRCRP
eukprot:2292730-Pyramimonas_sp.AAC.1